MAFRRVREGPWTLRPRDEVTLVFLDDYEHAADAAGTSMAGNIARNASVSPQHYIGRSTAGRGVKGSRCSTVLPRRASRCSPPLAGGKR